ncbi:MAG: hypothetical protein HY518_01580 [Candidatus Aenigmarchaeota archaeon]|nr:hypothetical protein [Candidatus Aenigmarchaeota archaeon]
MRVGVNVGPDGLGKPDECVGAMRSVYRTSAVDREGGVLEIYDTGHYRFVFDKLNEKSARRLADEINRIPGYCAKVFDFL